MTKEQYEKLKEWVIAVVNDRFQDSLEASIIRTETEQELDKLMGFEE